MNAKNRLGFLSFAQTVRPLLYIYLMYNLRTRIASAIFHAACYVILHVVLHIIRQSSDLLFDSYYIIRTQNCQSGKFIRIIVTQPLFFLFFNNRRFFPHMIFSSQRPHNAS